MTQPDEKFLLQFRDNVETSSTTLSRSSDLWYDYYDTGYRWYLDQDFNNFLLPIFTLHADFHLPFVFRERCERDYLIWIGFEIYFL